VEPVEGECLRAYAAAASAAGNPEKGLELLRRECLEGAREAKSQFLLARSLHAAGLDEESLVQLELALAGDPENAQMLHLKGLLCESRQHFEEAARCFEKILGRDGGFPSAYSGLARSYIATERYEEAAEIYRRSLLGGGVPSDPVYRELGRLYEGALADNEQALFWYQRHLTHCGEDPEVLARFRALAEQVKTFPGGVG
jgi:tetratricopeptide (TPR) repeat protein